ncbi:MAG: TRASH domain-containing protein [Alphaproteobacteria bacterium]|nr:TRASH domain-containing protein [Alphaproteobacteria bacterium]
MKKLLLTILMLFIAIPAMAAESGHEHTWLKSVEAKYVCMMNNKVFDTPQIAIEVEGKTYYGCCPMCADKLKNDASLRSAVDPVSGKQVDKSNAVIGADPHGMTYYFESQENFHIYASGPMPEMKHEHMEGMDMKGDMGHMMEGHDKGSEATAPVEPQATPENHESHH